LWNLVRGLLAVKTLFDVRKDRFEAGRERRKAAGRNPALRPI